MTVFAVAVLVMNVGSIIVASAVPEAATGTLVTVMVINTLLLLAIVVGNLDRGGKR